MKTLKQFLTESKFKKGDRVVVKPSYANNRSGEVGVVYMVGSGKLAGNQTVKFDDGQVISFADDEIELKT